MSVLNCPSCYARKAYCVRCRGIHCQCIWNTKDECDKKSFMSKVRKTKSCWLWTGTIIRGYGSFWMGHSNHIAHRVSWWLHKGVIPPETDVLHTCNNKACVNPDRLYLGTQKENTLDFLRLGKGNFGAHHNSAKLTPQTVNEIRRRFAAGESQGALAKVFRVHQSAISLLVNGKTWKSVEVA